MSGVLNCLLSSATSTGGGGFDPVTNTYNSPGIGNETIPTGATSLTITARSGSGGGAGPLDAGSGAFNPGAGGGEGSEVILTIAISPSDWGDTLAYFVGAQGVGGNTDENGGDGAHTTVTGTLNAGTVNVEAGGAQGGQGFVGGTGGVASGGNTNTDGNAGSVSAGGTGASGAPDGGAGGDSFGNAGFPGGDGSLSFAYT